MSQFQTYRIKAKIFILDVSENCHPELAKGLKHKILRYAQNDNHKILRYAQNDNHRLIGCRTGLLSHTNVISPQSHLGHSLPRKSNSRLISVTDYWVVGNFAGTRVGI